MSGVPTFDVGKKEKIQKRDEFIIPRRHIYAQYWQSDSDGQIYFPMVQMDPSDKQVLRRRNIFPMENK